MRLSHSFAAYLCITTGALARDFCTASQKCWPSHQVWSGFNASVGGRLVAPRPPAWPCHDPNYDEAACQIVQANWNNSFWRANQTGAMQDPIWESPGCGISTPRNVSCEQGFVPTYAIEAESPQDVSRAVKFAGKHRLRLVVKNTGHDYAEGSFSIWTHRLKGMNFTDSFVPVGCSKNARGVSAVTLGAAEQWRDVYQAADQRNLTIVGGAANSVGAAGGWVQGGGHSPLGSLYGMGVDNVLQYVVVKADGAIVTANSCQNKDLFWALRGGGGGTWGVTLDVTYKTHPALDQIVGMGITMNFTSPEKFTSMAENFLESFPDMSDQGIRGYAVWIARITFSIVVFHPNSPSVEHTNRTLAPIWDWLENNTDTQAFSFGNVHPTFFDMFKFWIATDVSIGMPTWIGSRLVSRKAMKSRPKDLAKLVLTDGRYIAPSMLLVGGGAVSKADPDSTSLNPRWRDDALISWNFGNNWEENTPIETIDNIKRMTTNFTQALGELAGLDHAGYFNEADPQEPRWKKAFFGQHYDRLLKIKNKVDPTGLFTCNRCVGYES
ncbi:FAD-binding domain protein [Ceratobasidium sp. AG-Ba]|nr:FAD-binding domain protein [Ceratobasidium sp. AG-Ba]QRW03464.1 FAD-binding domain protein [Ceratobasidium sp. AG-Ba]